MPHSKLSETKVERKGSEGRKALQRNIPHWSVDHFHLEELFISFTPWEGSGNKQGNVNYLQLLM